MLSVFHRESELFLVLTSWEDDGQASPSVAGAFSTPAAAAFCHPHKSRAG